MTADQVFALLSLLAVFAALVLGCLGWLTAMPDGSARFTRRLWAWICAAAFVFLSFDGGSHHWWQWVWVAVGGGYAVGRVRHWWQATERARALEAAYPWKAQ